MTWKKLVHNGVLFSPPPKPLPQVAWPKIKQNGKWVQIYIGDLGEEMLRAYIQMQNSPHFETKIFRTNFLKDFNQAISIKNISLTSLDDLDINTTSTWITSRKQEEKNIKDSLSRNNEPNLKKEYKEYIKDETDALKIKYGNGKIDDHKMEITTFRLPPGRLYVGHGEHPLRGKYVRRIEPKDVTLNISSSDDIPKPMYYESDIRNSWIYKIHYEKKSKTSVSKDKYPLFLIYDTNMKWGKVVQIKEYTWLVSWPHPLYPEKIQYIFPSMSSEPRIKKDREKYELARKLHDNISNIRSKYEIDLNSKDLKQQQIATIVALIDRIGLRVGHIRTNKLQKINKKKEKVPVRKSSPTYGASSLLCKHVSVIDEQTLRLNFPGKDSVQYNKKVILPKLVIKLIKNFMLNKLNDEMVFDKIKSANEVNEYLEELMPELTAKTFRTRASTDIVRSHLTQQNSKISDKKSNKYTQPIDIWVKANKEVAIFCNHINKTKDKESGKGTIKLSLGTSKANYIDPRVVFEFAIRHNIELKKIYPKTLLERYNWALEEVKQKM